MMHLLAHENHLVLPLVPDALGRLTVSHPPGPDQHSSHDDLLTSAPR